MTSTQIVMVPGFWLGAWAWDEVAATLRAQGFAVTALTPPGQGEDSDEVRATVTPQDQADALLAALDPGADRRVVVVHSGAAVAGTLLLDQHPDLVDHVVWVDTAPVTDGAVMNPDHAGDTYPLEAAWDDELEQGSMRGLTDAQLETFRTRAVPQPGRVLSTAVRLTDDRRLHIPGTVVCTSFSAEDYRSYAEQGVPFLAALPQHTALTYVDLPGGHWPMWSHPQELARVVADAAAPSADEGGQAS